MTAAERKKELRHFEVINDLDAYGLEDEDDDLEPENLGPTEKTGEQVEDIFRAVSSNMLFRNLA
eukprot:scaffold650488_cov56-Prasinocladus_malaysianus.AAC.1